jgi:hypothetical protein
MAYIFEEKEFRIAVRKLLKKRLYEEHAATVGDKALLPAVAELSDEELPEHSTINKSTVSSTNSGRDINAERRLRVDAQEAALDFEATIIDVLGLEDIRTLPDHLQEEYAKIMDVMSLGIQKSVQDAIASLRSFPRKNEE